MVKYNFLKKAACIALLTAFIFFPFFLSLSAQSTHQLLRKGDREYDLEHYKEAEQRYRNAAEKNAGDPKSQYNLGNALYQQGNWEDAAERFDQAARTATANALKADALHNLGNAQLKQHKFKEAVDAYENSLRLRPGDADTKQNLQMAKKKLKEEQQKQQQQNQQQQTPQEQQNQQDSSAQQQQNPAQQPNAGQQPKEEEQPVPDKEQRSPDRQQQLKKEEARQLLETAIGPEDQKNARKYREQRQQPKPSGKEKDW